MIRMDFTLGNKNMRIKRKRVVTHMLSTLTSTYAFMEKENLDANGWPLYYSDLSHEVGKITHYQKYTGNDGKTYQRGMLTVGYEFTKAKAIAYLCGRHLVSKENISAERHKHGGTMFYIGSKHVGSVGPRRADQRNTIFSGDFWVTPSEEEFTTIEKA